MAEKEWFSRLILVYYWIQPAFFVPAHLKISSQNVSLGNAY